MEIRGSTLHHPIRCVALILFFLGAPARADFFLHSWETQHADLKWLNLDADLGFFTSAENYDSTGSKFQPSGLTSYSHSGLDIDAAYGFTQRFSAFARLSWARVSVESNKLNGSSYGFADQSLGFTLRALPGPLTLDFQAQVDLPLYNNDGSRADLLPVLGDGSTDLTVGGFLGYPLASFEDARLLGSAGVGYTHRSAGLSAAIPYSAIVRLAPRRNGLTAQLGLVGMVSLSTDAQPGATVETGGDSLSGAGGSYISNAVDPSEARARVGIGWKFEAQTDIQAQLRAEVPLRAENSPSGTLVTVGLQIRLPGEGAAEPRAEADIGPRRRHKSPHDLGTTGFLTYTLEAKVTLVNDRLNVLKINKGEHDNIAVGQLFDIFSARPDGSLIELIARTRVTAVKEEEAACEISEYYKEAWIEQGFVAKRVTPQ